MYLVDFNSLEVYLKIIYLIYMIFMIFNLKKLLKKKDLEKNNDQITDFVYRTYFTQIFFIS
jgi:hypothetical protein